MNTLACWSIGISLMFFAAGSLAQSTAQESNLGPIPKIDLQPVMGGMTFTEPVDLQSAPGNAQDFYVVERPGRILAVDMKSSSPKKRTFLDIRKDKVNMRHSEEGLLALAFAPDYEQTGHLYVYYTAAKPRRGVLARFTASPSSEDQEWKVDPTTEEVILSVEQPWGNHNGSTVLFGPDGYLYISLGDGGAANDPHENGQDLSTLLGTVLRIDVSKASENHPYSIPPDNPFVNDPQARDEIWAYGLRNVWRMSFDRKSGALWAGDVGQNAWEEVDIITKGGNYGWKAREGKHEFDPEAGQGPYVEPIFEYDRRHGGSITGGYVYRGRDFPQLDGVYLMADYMSGRVWGLREKDGQLVDDRIVFHSRRPGAISSFGEGPNGELYACGFDAPYARKGTIYRVVPAP